MTLYNKSDFLNYEIHQCIGKIWICPMMCHLWNLLFLTGLERQNTFLQKLYLTFLPDFFEILRFGLNSLNSRLFVCMYTWSNIRVFKHKAFLVCLDGFEEKQYNLVPNEVLLNDSHIYDQNYCTHQNSSFVCFVYRIFIISDQVASLLH